MPTSRPPPSPQRPPSPDKDLFDTSGDADILGDLLPGDEDEGSRGGKGKGKVAKEPETTNGRENGKGGGGGGGEGGGVRGGSRSGEEDKLFGGDFMASLMGGGGKKEEKPKSNLKTFDFDLDDKYKNMSMREEESRGGGGGGGGRGQAETNSKNINNFTPSKAPKKTSADDDFLFGGYMPSSTEKPSAAAPSTAATSSPMRNRNAPASPAKREKKVSLSKDDDDFFFGGYAPSASNKESTSSPLRKPPEATSFKMDNNDDDDWLADLKNSRNRSGAKSPGDSAARKATADWLGLDESELVSPSRPKTPLSSRTSSPLKMDPEFERAMYGSGGGGGGRSSPTRRQISDSPTPGHHHPAPRQPRSRRSSTRSGAAEAFLGLGEEVAIVDEPLPAKVVRRKPSGAVGPPEAAIAAPTGGEAANMMSAGLGDDDATQELKKMIENQQLQMQKNQAAFEAELKKKQMANFMKQQEMQLQQQMQQQQQQMAALAAASSFSTMAAGFPGFSGDGGLGGVGGERNMELEKKVFKLELEKENLEARLELVISRHQMEMEELTEFHRRKEARKEEEREDRCEELKRRIAVLEEAKDKAAQVRK